MSPAQHPIVWTRRQALRMVAGVTGGLALHACAQSTGGPAEPAETSAASPQAAAEPIKATSGSTLWIGYTPLYIGVEKGFFRESGLDLDYKDFSSGTDANAAFSAGRLDAISNVTSEMVTLAANGVDFKIVMAADNSLGGDGILARNSVKDIADFKGKTVAVEEGGVSHFFLLQVLKEAGLSGSDIKLVNVTPDAAAAAYQSGKADIAVTYSPFLAKANQAQKDGRIIFDTSKMPTAIIDIHSFNTKFIEANPGAVEAFVKGTLKSLDFIKTNPTEAYTIAGKRLELSPEEVEAELKGVRLIDKETNLEILNTSLLPHLEELSAFLLEQKQIQKAPDLSKLIDPQYLQAV